MTDLGQIRAIIYDCDGVLFDTREANEAYYNNILAHFRQPPLSDDHREKIQFLTAGEVIGLLFESTGFLEDAQNHEQSMDNSLYLPLIHQEPHAKEALNRLRKSFLTCIVTNRGKSLRPLLDYHGFTSLFAMIVSSYDVSSPKPHPEGINLFLKRFQILPEQSIYVGDSHVDSLLCERAGVPFVAYKNTGLPALYHLRDHFELVHILERQPLK